MNINEARQERRGGKIKKLLAVSATALLASVALAIPALAATPPIFPNNIVVFPERDFVVLEGYEAKAGQSVTITVTRGGVLSGRASGVVGAGDPSIEVNHPGGVCWGPSDLDPSAPDVTPNIKPGDVVTATFGDGQSDSTRTSSAAVTGFRKVGTNQLVVNGRVGAALNKANIEQRIVNPDLTPTDVGRRDIRAPSRPGPYTSSLTFPTATTFQATYTFRTDANTSAAEATRMRNIAAEGQMRVLS